MITKEERKRMFETIPDTPPKRLFANPKKLFARVVKDYEREWLEYTLPAGTIVPIEIYMVPPDVVIIGDKLLVVVASDAEYFEVIE